VIVKNDVLGQIKWEQMVFLGNPEYGVELAPIDFVKVAEACGGTGITIDDPRTCGADLEAALGMPGPVVVQAVVDPLEAPLPPRITPEQALHFAESLLRGEPDRVEIAKNAFGRKIRELV
jgi:pyruvate dehydrogenase (quinone)/pyruvate oxidase